MKITEQLKEKKIRKIAQLVEDNRYDTFDESFLGLHARDQVRVFELLDDDQRRAVYYLLTPTEMADLFDIMEDDSEELETYFLEMNSEYAADLLNKMQVDNAVDALAQFGDAQQDEFFTHMAPEEVGHFEEMLAYHEDSAGSIMTTEYIFVDEKDTIAEALHKLKVAAPSAETIYYLYVADADQHLTGVLSLRDLVVGEDHVPVKEIMNEDLISVLADTDQEEVAHLFREYDFLAIPVVNNDNQLIGIITVDDIMDVIDDEAAEDYSGLAAVNVEERADTPAQSAKSRLPWLVALLVLGLGTSSLIGLFEGTVSRAPVLAAFISLTTGTAGNAGTQSLAVAIRRLSTFDIEDISPKKVFIREALTGLLTGVVVGVSAFLIVGFWQTNVYLGGVVGIAVMFAVFIATLAGTYVPVIIQKLGFDPAVASGPFITTVVDLTSVMIYFSVAQLFLTYLL